MELAACYVGSTAGEVKGIHICISLEKIQFHKMIMLSKFFISFLHTYRTLMGDPVEGRVSVQSLYRRTKLCMLFLSIMSSLITEKLDSVCISLHS